MKIYAIYDQASRNIVTFVGSQSEQDLSAHPGLAAREVESTPLPRPAGYSFDADWAIQPRTPPLPDLRRAKEVECWQYFELLFVTPRGFTFRGKLVQIDDASRVNISAAVNDALASLQNSTAFPFQVPYWVCADNSHLTLEGPDDMVALGRAVLAYFQACRVNLRAIKTAIAASADATALAAIDVSAGYPAATDEG
jgi:hypothetical protein